MKREREPACPVCGHYHKWEQGEVCTVCGHNPTCVEKASPPSAFPSEILPGFLYLGSYDNASRSEILKMLGVKYILNTVPNCQNLYKNSFTYFNVTETGKTVPLEECLNFIASVEQQSSRVLVHCMSGKSRSTSVVVAFLMKSRGWSLAQSLEYVVQRRPTVDLTEVAKEQLQAFEQHVSGRPQAALPIPSMAPQPPPTPLFGGSFPPCPTQPLFNFGGAERPPPTPNFTGQSSVFSIGSSGQESERPQTFIFGARHEVSAQTFDARSDGMDTGG